MEGYDIARQYETAWPEIPTDRHLPVWNEDGTLRSVLMTYAAHGLHCFSAVHVSESGVLTEYLTVLDPAGATDAAKMVRHSVSRATPGTLTHDIHSLISLNKAFLNQPESERFGLVCGYLDDSRDHYLATPDRAHLVRSLEARDTLMPPHDTQTLPNLADHAR